MMNYTRRLDTDKAVEMQISSFTGKGGTTEYQVMVFRIGRLIEGTSPPEVPITVMRRFP